jgi:hypothetical protein
MRDELRQLLKRNPDLAAANPDLTHYVDKTKTQPLISVPSEHQIQTELIQRIQLAATQYPPLNLLLAIPNGGARHPLVGAHLKAEGVRKGVPDLFLPVARTPYHGLFIEMKRPNGRLSPEQKEWLDHLEKQFYLCKVCFSADDAFTTLVDYVKR